MTGFDAVEAQQHIAQAKSKHVEVPGYDGINGNGGYCDKCSETWPCFTTQIADHLVLAVAEVTRLQNRLDIENRNWLRRIEQDREFLTQVAASHGITEDQVTVAFLAKRAARFGSTEPERN